MKEPLWQRVRRQRNRAGDGDAAAPVARTPSSSRVGAATADPSPGRGSGDEESSLADLDGVGLADDKAAEYAEWAARMKAKRAEKVDSVRRLNDTAAEERPSYWSAEAVWEESRRLEAENLAVIATRAELLAVLGLGRDATRDEIQATYRQRAKDHHPDRFPEADEATRAYHVEQMQRITAAYRALQLGPKA